MKKSSPYSQLSVLFKLLKFSEKYYFQYILLCVLALVLSVIGVLDAESLRRMVNGATSSDTKLLITGIVMAISLMIISTLLDWYRAYSTSKLNLNTTTDLQMKVIDKLNRSKLSYFQNYHSGDLFSRIHDSTKAAQTSLNQQMMQLIQNTFTVVFLIVYLSILNWKLTLLTLFFAGAMPSLMNFLAKRVREIYDEQQKEEAKFQSFIQESVQGAEVVRSFSMLGILTEKFQHIYTGLLRYLKKSAFYQAVINQTSTIVILGGMLFILSYGGRLVFLGELDIGAVIAFIISFERLISPLSSLLNTWPQLQKSISAAKRVFDILEFEEEGEVSGKKVQLTINKSSFLKFHNVSYRYDGSTKVDLNQLTMTFEVGKKTAIVGPSGGGKSTILKLLMRFNTPESGQILYNQLDVSDIPLTEWRDKIAYVSQETTLFTGSFMNNIRYGRLGATDEEVIDAAKSANIHDTILEAENGYHTMIGEDGSNLSGGQRQRIALARALLRRPLIYVFDEPTSSLDLMTERTFQEALDEVTKDKNSICIIVSHRLNTIRNADYIYVMKEGELSEEGQPFELYDQKGLYYQLSELDA